MDEFENRQSETYREGTIGQYDIPCVDVEQYKTAGNAYAVNGKYKTRKPRKKHPYLKKAIFTMSCGLLFGLFAGLGVYMILSFSGVNARLLRVDNLSKETEKQINWLMEAGKTENTVKSQTSVETEENKETQIQKTETVTAVVTDVTAVVETAMPCVVSITNLYSAMDWYGDQVQEEASGSGIIIGENEDELLIVTNYHVIEDCEELSVQFIDNFEVLAYVKGTDVENDLAVISVFLEDLTEDTKKAIAVATLGNSDALRVGEPAIAIGNALGYGQSVTTGVISALNREVSIGDTTSYFIQTDAAINPGNSGGALINVKGEVIGINSNKIADYIIEGMGYAIPIATAKPVIEELVQHETRKKVSDSERSFLGISGTDVTQDAIAMYDMPAGVYVAQVLEDTGAEGAGIQKGDIIVSFDGEKITQMTQLQDLLSYYAAGSTVEVTIMRPGEGGYKELVLTVTLGYQRK